MGKENSQPYFQIQHSNDIEALNINLLNEQFYKEVSVSLTTDCDLSRKQTCKACDFSLSLSLSLFIF